MGQVRTSIAESKRVEPSSGTHARLRTSASPCLLLCLLQYHADSAVGSGQHSWYASAAVGPFSSQTCVLHAQCTDASASCAIQVQHHVST
jgi:hypothetical protein